MVQKINREKQQLQNFEEMKVRERCEMAKTYEQYFQQKLNIVS